MENIFAKKVATKLDVMKAMDAIDECLDILVKETSKKEEPVLGLIMNNKLLVNALV